MVKTNTQNQILAFIEMRGEATVKGLAEEFSFSREMIHRHIKTLCSTNKIKKIGSAPRVFYVPAQEKETVVSVKSDIIDENWLEILPNGEFQFGAEGFGSWCIKRNFNILEKIDEYEKIYFQKEKLKKNELIDATNKLTKTFSQNYLEKIWYVDFYSWEIFGKTTLGKLILHAKQNSDEILMKRIAEKIKAPIVSLIGRGKFDMIGLIPHSVPRKKDFLETTISFLHIAPKPKKLFTKIFAQHVVAQKTLKSKEERQINAENTLFLNEEVIPKKVLLIDDACGSGATLNIAAQKIKQRFPKTKVYGLTFVGSMNGFDVINQV